MARLGVARIAEVRHHAAAPTVPLRTSPLDLKRLGPSHPEGEACPMRPRFLLAGIAAIVACVMPGCASTGTTKVLGDNPIIVPSGDFEAVWNASVVVVDQYFDIFSEDRIQRKIVTNPKSGATLLEPWDGDSVDLYERLECTLQTIRRFAIVTIEPAPNGQGWAVRVEVQKQLEDLAQPDRQSIGRAVFNNQAPVNRTREVVGPVQAPAYWIPRGRDPKLEQVILAKIKSSLFL
jgi:hypothetical protein